MARHKKFKKKTSFKKGLSSKSRTNRYARIYYRSARKGEVI